MRISIIGAIALIFHDANACWPILRSNSPIRPSLQRCFPLPGTAFPVPCRNSRRQRWSTFGLTSSALDASAIDTPCSSRLTAANLNSFVNNLRELLARPGNLRVTLAVDAFPDHHQTLARSSPQ